MHPPPAADYPASRGFAGQQQQQQQAQQGRSQGVGCFPSRPGQPLCDFYTKTGHCKYGEACKFDHPLQYAVQLNSVGLPIRPAEAVCTFYEKTGACKFGPACKFNHPERPAGS
jgi:serine/threonine-protein kinase/endoribonuclease IRE1